MLLATPPLGLDLPTVSADELRSCRVRVNSTTLLACALLLPAGTGTQSLHDFMETMLGTPVLDDRCQSGPCTRRMSITCIMSE